MEPQYRKGNNRSMCGKHLKGPFITC